MENILGQEDSLELLAPPVDNLVQQREDTLDKERELLQVDNLVLLVDSLARLDKQLEVGNLEQQDMEQEELVHNLGKLELEVLRNQVLNYY